MTGQISDSFLYKGERYFLTGYTKGEPFSPLDFGFFPKAATTACWRGFVLYYTVKDDYLTLVDMEINNEEELELNDVQPKVRKDSLRLHYPDVNLKLDYSGKIIIAKDFIKSMYVHMGFQRSMSYENVLELEFEKGQLISETNLSEKMKKKRKKNTAEYAEPPSRDEKDIRSWIERTFSRDHDSDEYND